jgi:hypothetical protein
VGGVLRDVRIAGTTGRVRLPGTYNTYVPGTTIRWESKSERSATTTFGDFFLSVPEFK